MNVVQIKNPRALLIPDMQKFFEKVLKAFPRLAPLGLGSIAEDLFAYVTREDYFMLLGMEDKKPVGLLLGHFHQNNMVPYAMIDILYNDGSPSVSKALREKAIDIFTSAGYTKVWASNLSDINDKTWVRAMKLSNIDIQPLGTVFEIGVK